MTLWPPRCWAAVDMRQGLGRERGRIAGESQPQTPSTGSKVPSDFTYTTRSNTKSLRISRFWKQGTKPSMSPFWAQSPAWLHRKLAHLVLCCNMKIKGKALVCSFPQSFFKLRLHGNRWITVSLKTMFIQIWWNLDDAGAVNSTNPGVGGNQGVSNPVTGGKDVRHYILQVMLFDPMAHLNWTFKKPVVLYSLRSLGNKHAKYMLNEWINNRKIW